MVAPNSNATIGGAPRMVWAASAMMPAVINTPTVAMTTMVIQTFFRTSIRSAAPAVEQNVAGAEQKNDLVQRRIRLDLDKVQRLRTDRHAGDQKHRDIGNADLLRQQRGDSADGQNKTERQQRMLGDLDGGRRFQWATSCGSSDSLVQRPQPCTDVARGDIGPAAATGPW